MPASRLRGNAHICAVIIHCITAAPVLRVAACQTLDKGEYLIYREFAAEVTLGVYLYIIQRCRSPPPRLFLANPRAYSKLVLNAGGKAMCKYVRYAGVPGFAWLFCQRTNNGRGLLGLDTLMYHVARATSHKTNYVVYSAQHIALHSAMHPKIRAVAEAMMSISALGRMHIGRIVEPTRASHTHSDTRPSYSQPAHLHDEVRLFGIQDATPHSRVRVLCACESAWCASVSAPTIGLPSTSGCAIHTDLYLAVVDLELRFEDHEAAAIWTARTIRRRQRVPCEMPWVCAGAFVKAIAL